MTQQQPEHLNSIQWYWRHFWRLARWLALAAVLTGGFLLWKEMHRQQYYNSAEIKVRQRAVLEGGSWDKAEAARRKYENAEFHNSTSRPASPRRKEQ